MRTWLAALDKNLLAYWLGLVMLFIGLSLRVSTATALIVCGAVIAVVSIVNSYVILWFYRASAKAKDK